MFEFVPSPPLTTSQVDLLRTDNLASDGCASSIGVGKTTTPDAGTSTVEPVHRVHVLIATTLLIFLGSAKRGSHTVLIGLA